MEKSTIYNLSDNILKRIEDGREIRDEQILLFLEWALDVVEKKEFQNMPRSYFLLKEKIYKYRMYDTVEELTAKQAFSYGNLWSSIRLIEIAEKRKKEEISIAVLVKKYIKNIEVFHIIKNNPGIKHKDLAEKCGKTVSELSQFFNQIAEENFFSFIRLGREKYYYLEDKGVCLLEQMEEQSKISEVSTEQLATKELFINTNINTADNNNLIKISGQFEYNKDIQNEYLDVLKSSVHIMFSDFKGFTLYDSSDKEYSSIKHFCRHDSKVIKVFEGIMKKPIHKNEEYDLNDISAQYPNSVLEQNSYKCVSV